MTLEQIQPWDTRGSVSYTHLFASGAVAVGNEVEVFDAATANLNGCHADKSCEQRGCRCV